MGIEIERRFLVVPSRLPDSLGAGSFLVQGYMSRNPVVRPRMALHEGSWLTIKGPGTLKRPEYEYDIPEEEALDMLADMCFARISKIRYAVEVGGHSWDLDNFMGRHEKPNCVGGKWLAEIELPETGTTFELPSWVGKEVTEDSRYSNINLAEHGWPVD